MKYVLYKINKNGDNELLGIFDDINNGRAVINNVNEYRKNNGFPTICYTFSCIYDDSDVEGTKTKLVETQN